MIELLQYIGNHWFDIAACAVFFSLVGRFCYEILTEKKEKENTEIYISAEGRVWIDPKELAKSPEFQKQVQAAKKMREEST